MQASIICLAPYLEKEGVSNPVAISLKLLFGRYISLDLQLESHIYRYLMGDMFHQEGWFSLVVSGACGQFCSRLRRSMIWRIPISAHSLWLCSKIFAQASPGLSEGWA